MKLRGGYSPRIAGEPSSSVEPVPVPDSLRIPLVRQGTVYTPLVRTGARVKFGEALASARIGSGKGHCLDLCLPAPATGTIHSEVETGGLISVLTLSVDEPLDQASRQPPTLPSKATRSDQLRRLIAQGGIWPSFWSSARKGMPDPVECPLAIIVPTVFTEPFRAQGDVVIDYSRRHFIRGIDFLQQLLPNYAAFHLVLADPTSRLAKFLHEELASKSSTHLHFLPRRYPTEEPELLWRALLREQRTLSANAPVWVTDPQAVIAVASYVSDGVPLTSRIIAVGGPACQRPRHILARVGTPLRSFIELRPGVRILRGGVFHGTPASPDQDAVSYDDDAFFLVQEPSRREFLGFIRPGLLRQSYSRCFLSSFFPAKEERYDSSLRGEVRPCVSCGFCEEVCPAGIMPHLIHKYLFRQLIDEALDAGLERCVHCGLCSYVCPSKIDLAHEFVSAQEEIRAEVGEATQIEIDP